MLQVLHAVKAHRKLKQAGIGQRLVHDVLCLELEKDGSDTWRLEPVIEVLKQGGVSSTWVPLAIANWFGLHPLQCHSASITLKCASRKASCRAVH